MNLRNTFFTIQQKWKYYTAKDDFEKLSAEINQYEKIVTRRGEEYFLRGCKVGFDVRSHLFVLRQYRLFSKLLQQHTFNFEILQGKLLCRINDIRVFVTTAEEILILHEIWVRNVYNVEVNTTRKLVVIDVGMNVGYASLFFASQAEVEKVYSFEPFYPTYNQALVNLKLNPVYTQKIEPLNFGLFSKDVELEVDYSPEHRGRTGIWGSELILEKISVVQKEKLRLKRFSSEILNIMARHGECDFVLKIDCEGSEYAIFESVEPEVLSRVRALMIEWHRKGPEELLACLKRNKFSVLSFDASSQKVGMVYAFK